MPGAARTTAGCDRRPHRDMDREAADGHPRRQGSRGRIGIISDAPRMIVIQTNSSAFDRVSNGIWRIVARIHFTIVGFAVKKMG